MKKIILIILLAWIAGTVSAQKTTGGNYTYIAQRYEWLAGVFKALGLPAGSGPAAFTTGQEPRAGAVYYDSLGVDAGLYIWDGAAWTAAAGGVSQSALDDTAAAIRNDIPTLSAQTLQQTFDREVGGSVLTKSDTVDMNTNGLTFLDGRFGVGAVSNSLFRVGLTTSSFLTIDPTNDLYEMGDINGIGNSTYMSLADALGNIDFNANGAMRWGVDTLATRAYARSVGGGSTGEWDGSVIGTTFSATSTTINSGAVQWTFTGSSPATFTLPARTSSVNQFYLVRNMGSADLTIAAAGTDDIYTTSAVTSFTLAVNESVMINGAANGTSDLWTTLFHTSVGGNLLFDSLGTAGISPVTSWNNTLYGRRISVSGGTIDTTASGGLLITIPATGAATDLSNLTSPTAINQHLIPATTNTYDLGTTATLFRNMYAHGYVIKNSSNGLTTLAGAPSASNFTATFPAATGPVALTNLAQSWSGIQTLTSLTVASGGLVSSLTNANFAYGTASGLSSTTSAAFLLETNANVNYRVAIHGASAIATANSSAGSFLIAENTIQEASSLNHDLLYTMAIKPSIVTGAAGTVTNTATLEVVGPMSATVSGANWAFRVKSGNVQFLNGNLSLSTAGNKLNIATGSNASVGISGAMTAGSITISTTAVTANSIISLTPVGTGTGVLSLGTVTAGTSFVINSSDNTDTRIVHWKIIN